MHEPLEPIDNVTQRQEESRSGTELNAEQQLEKEELCQQWNRNFEKYIKSEISHREFSTKAKPPPNKVKLAIMDQIVEEEMNRIEEDYGMNMWTLNVIYYSTAVTLLKKEGNLRKEHIVRRPHKKPGWKVRHESRIRAIRKKISYTFVLIECKCKQKFTTNYQTQDRKAIWQSNNIKP